MEVNTFAFTTVMYFVVVVFFVVVFFLIWKSFTNYTNPVPNINIIEYFV